MTDPDIYTGSAAGLLGGAGLTIQYMTDFGSLVAVFLNIVLAVGGLTLVWIKIRNARKMGASIKEK